MQQLTADQLALVESTEPRVLGRAGPGAGKTTCLEMRIGLLIDRGLSSSRITCFTFAVRAAQMMSHRIKQRHPGVELGFCGTIHSWSLGMLNHFAKLLGYREGISIYDKDQADLLLDVTCRELGYRKAKGWTDKLSKAKVKLYFEAFKGDADISHFTASQRHATQLIHKTYLLRMRTANAMDYAGILYNVLKLLREHQKVRDWCRTYIKHLVVDEWQDLNREQHQIIEVLAGPANLTAVGDIRQSIFGFIGSRPDLGRKAAETCKVYHLRDTFRCPAKVCRAANDLISHDGDHEPMRPANIREGLIRARPGRSYEIAEIIHELLTECFHIDDIVVLARVHSKLQDAEDDLTAAGIPTSYKWSGPETQGFAALMACFKLVNNPEDEAAFLLLRRYLNVNSRDYAKLRQIAVERGCGLWRAWQGDNALGLVLKDSRADQPGLALAHQVLASDVFGPDIFHAQEAATWICKLRPDATVRQMIQTYYSWRPDDETAGTGVTLSTIHACVDPLTVVETIQGLQRIEDIAGCGIIATTEGAQKYKGRAVFPPTDMLRVGTKSWYEVGVTKNHGLMVWNGQMFARKHARDLRLGDWLRVKLGATIEPEKPPRLPIRPTGLDIRARTHYRIPFSLTLDLAEFLGLMVADGTLYRLGFRLMKEPVEVVDRFAKLGERIFGATAHRSMVQKTTKAIDLAEFCSVFIATWLRSIGGMAPKEKAIPKCILAAPLKYQARFLRGLFEDGTVGVKNGRLDHVDWSNKSEDMVSLVQTILLRFGIVSSRRPVFQSGRVDPQWHLYIYGTNARLFGKTIGLITHKKKRALRRPVGRETMYSVPISRAMASSIAQQSARQNAKFRGSLSRQTCRDLGLAVDLGFHYEKITKLEPYWGASMCVSVPGVGRFLQNGIDGCNSKGLEWPVVVVLGCNEGSIPYKFAVDADDIAEERRLFYVAITRASERVVCIYSPKSEAGGSPHSEFITEAKIPMPIDDDAEVDRLRSCDDKNRSVGDG